MSQKRKQQKKDETSRNRTLKAVCLSVCRHLTKSQDNTVSKRRRRPTNRKKKEKKKKEKKKKCNTTMRAVSAAA